MSSRCIVGSPAISSASVPSAMPVRSSTSSLGSTCSKRPSSAAAPMSGGAVATAAPSAATARATMTVRPLFGATRTTRSPDRRPMPASAAEVRCTSARSSARVQRSAGRPLCTEVSAGLSSSTSGSARSRASA
jgi:hypothetical protein